MKTIAISKPLQAVLCAVVALTLVALLKTDPLDPQAGAIARPRLTARLDTAPGEPAPGVAPAWERPARDAWVPDQPAPVPPVAAPAAAAAVRQVVAMSPESGVSVPSTPDPGLVYLGRIEQDQRHFVFLGRGSVPQVIEVGGTVDAQWRVERATATQVELRHLASNGLHGIAIR